MAKFTAAPGLEEAVLRMIVPHVQKVAEEVAGVARLRAPGTKVWVTRENGQVCEHCRPVHLTELPANLRFDVKSYEWDIQHKGAGPRTYLLRPREENELSEALMREQAWVLVTHCKCFLEEKPDGIAKLIAVGQPVITGKKVTVSVVAEGKLGPVDAAGRNLLAECEVGQHYPQAPSAEGTHFMENAGREVARLRRARQ